MSAPAIPIVTDAVSPTTEGSDHMETMTSLRADEDPTPCPYTMIPREKVARVITDAVKAMTTASDKHREYDVQRRRLIRVMRWHQARALLMALLDDVVAQCAKCGCCGVYYSEERGNYCHICGFNAPQATTDDKDEAKRRVRGKSKRRAKAAV